MFSTVTITGLKELLNKHARILIRHRDTKAKVQNMRSDCQLSKIHVECYLAECVDNFVYWLMQLDSRYSQ